MTGTYDFSATIFHLTVTKTSIVEVHRIQDPKWEKTLSDLVYLVYRVFITDASTYTLLQIYILEIANYYSGFRNVTFHDNLDYR